MTEFHKFAHISWNYGLPDFYLKMILPFYCLETMYSFVYAGHTFDSLLHMEIL